MSGRREATLSISGKRLGKVVTLAGVFLLAVSANAIAAPKVRVRILDGAQRFTLRGFDLQFQATGNTLAGRARPRNSGEAPIVTSASSWGGKYGGIKALRLQQSSALSVVNQPLSSPRRSLAARADQLSEWRISCPNGGVVHAEQISRTTGRMKNIYFPGPVSVDSPAGFLNVRGKPYRERVVVHPISTKKGWECEVVNHVDIESYLDGLVNAEFSAAWSQEAIDAQVIAARTYAYYQMKLMSAKKGGVHYDLDSDIKDQVYDGTHREDYRSRRSAVRTRGMILKTSARDPWPIKAYYHSTCGGTTELPEVVWGSTSSGFKKRVACAYCQSSPSFIWDVPLSSKDIVQVLLKGGREVAPSERDQMRNWPMSWERDLPTSRLLSLRVTEQNASGRAERVVSQWKNLEGKEFTLEMSGTLFRSWVGSSRLKSTVFQVLAAGQDAWVLRGRGFGHGVGLCQWGAKTMGESGKKARQILKHYYPDAIIARAW